MNTCVNCKDKGYTEAYPIDGFTLYLWVKPYKYPCRYCKKGELYKHKYGEPV